MKKERNELREDEQRKHETKEEGEKAGTRKGEEVKRYKEGRR